MARLTLVKVRLVWWELCFLGWGLELRVMWVGVKLKNCAILKKLCNPSDSNLLAVGLPLLECWRCEEGKFYLNSRFSQTMFIHVPILSKQTRRGKKQLKKLLGKKETLSFFLIVWRRKKLIGLLSSWISTLTSLLKLCTGLVGTDQVDWK